MVEKLNRQTDIQIFNAARLLSHMEAAPEKSGFVLPWPWLETVCTTSPDRTMCKKVKVCKLQNLERSVKIKELQNVCIV